jgi:hypothetical protein
LHSVANPTALKCSPSLSLPAEPPNSQLGTNRHYDKFTVNGNIATTTQHVSLHTTVQASQPVTSQQPKRVNDQGINMSPDRKKSVGTNEYLSGPDTSDSIVSTSVAPKVTTSPLRQHPINPETSMSTSIITSSCRKRRRCRNVVKTTVKSPSSKDKVIYTLDTDDDEFAFLGG